MLPKVLARRKLRIERPQIYMDLISAYKAVMQYLGSNNDFVIDQTNDHIFHSISKWFCMDSPDEIDPHKGILLRGEKGTGKTTMMYALGLIFKRYYAQQAEFISARGLAELYRKEENEMIMKLRNRHVVIIDDLGTEEFEVKCYGTVQNPFLDVFETRYNLRKTTFITTNLGISTSNGILGIKERYGDRIVDRLKETMNDLVLTGKSRR